MNVEADYTKHQVILTTDAGSEIALTWAAAANLSSLLNEASRQAEPAPARGKRYQPATERDRR